MTIRLRQATHEDARFLFELRNEPSVRAASFSSEAILFPDHERWLKEKLKDKNSPLWIAELDGQPIGQVRFDVVSKEEAEINIAIQCASRGKGYGTEVVRRASRDFFDTFQNINTLRAHIKPDNRASVKTFQKSGYRIKSETDIKGIHSLSLVLNRYL
ncbi:MAG: N-acetyltransferase GCN5 [Parcubacteria group bacterium Greene0416_79]|nr:MAG: N-acetyltransferase GCN5 [Parcubacteria group bacterium Greene0416_79]